MTPLKLLLGTLLITITYCYEDQSILKIKDGQIKGRILRTRNNNTFYSYQQIPFAEPPIGKLRFEAPVPAKTWNGVLDCTKNTKICMQEEQQLFLGVGLETMMQGLNRQDLETEDCLYVNVYTPVKPGDEKSLPVIYYIHGGAYVRGHGIFDKNGPHYFIDNNVVLVTVTYRLGAFGFISTNDLELPGNNGLKDQHLGSKWVQDNIKYFGGDPEKVTIMGQSAGAGSVAFQIMKKEKLFRGAILQSGSSLIPGLYQRGARSMAFSLGSKLNFTGTTSKELKEFLRNAKAADFKQAAKEVMGNTGYYFSPVIEENHTGAFITRSMYDLVDAGDFNRVPIIIGITSEEQITKNAEPDFPKSMQKFDENPSLLVNDDFHINDSDTKTLVGLKIKEIYTNGSFHNDALASIRYTSDEWIIRSIMRFADLYSKYEDVYFHKFSYFGPLGHNQVKPIPGAGRVAHSDDNHYLWVTNGNDSEILSYPEEDQLTSQLYVKLFTNFAKNLKPTDSSTQNLTWLKMEPGSFKYLNINNTVEMDVNPRGDSYEKWVELYDKYAVKPLDTF